MLLIEMVGRRFEFVDRSFPDVTVIGMAPKANTIRLHVLDGRRELFALDAFVHAYQNGDVLETLAAPFEHPRETKFDRKRAALRRYVAGPNKQPNSRIGVL